MYQALYRKYRPKNFKDVVGQNVVVKTLSNSIINNKISHAYLFTGPRGTGKTSIAKIVAQIINCKNLDGVTLCNKCVCCTQKQNTDIIEIDAASNNGVEEIRELRNKVNLVPSYGKYKIYIIDEVHMLTPSAFNALLKTLEEPPQHIIFILATTEPHKIPQTILSRCQRYDFKKISESDIKSRIEDVSEKEKINISDESIDLIAKFCDGGLRDALGLLDQLSSYTNDLITPNDVHDVYGTILDTDINKFVNEIKNKNLIQIYNYIDEYDKKGKNLSKIIDQIINYLKNTLIYLNSSDYFKNKELANLYKNTLENLTENQIYRYIDVFLESLKNIKLTNNVRLTFELTIIKLLEENKNANPIENKTIEASNILKEKIKPIQKEIVLDSVNIDDKKIKRLEEIRINNTLCNFSKKDLLEFGKKIDEISTLIINPDYSTYASLILDGTLKAKGNDNLIFVYPEEKMKNYFNTSLEIIQKIFNITFNNNYFPIAVTTSEWEIIKNEFNKNLKNKTKKYVYIEEKEIEKENTNTEIKKNIIDEMFDNIEYN